MEDLARLRAALGILALVATDVFHLWSLFPPCLVLPNINISTSPSSPTIPIFRYTTITGHLHDITRISCHTEADARQEQKAGKGKQVEGVRKGKGLAWLYRQLRDRKYAIQRST